MRGNGQKHKVIAREIAYHGTSLGALSATGITELRSQFEPLTPGGCHVPNTNLYRWPEDRHPLWAATAIEERIQFEGPETVAAVILEPVQNAGGCFVPPDGYFERVREICDRYDVLMISDEVICAWGRLGHYFGCDRFGYVPDIITVAKALTSAYAPMGAMIASDRVAEPFMQGDASFAHGFTFAGHPLASAIAMANLDVFEREDLCGHVLAKEGEFRQMLETLHEIPIVGDVRGAGYFQAIELVKDKETKESFSDEESEDLLRGFLSGELYKPRPDLPRRRPRRPRGPARPAADRRHRAVRGDPRRAARRARPRPGSGSASRRPMLTVQSLLDELGLDLAAGTQAAEAPVRWVHISELEDPTPWLSGGELMLTTGIPLDTAAKQRAFVRLLADHNLAGLGFGTGFSHQKLPKALLEEARKRDFPLFEVPYSTPFIAITEKAFARLVNEQYEVLQRGIAVQRRLERLVLEERGLEEIAATISSAVGGTVAILDGRGERIAGRGFRRELSADAVAAIRKEALSHAGDGHPFVPAHPSVAGRALAHPVISPGGGPPQAWVVIVRDSGGLGDFERLILQQAVAVVALELMRRRVARETERRLAGDVLAGALGGRLEPSELRRRLEPFGIGDEAAVLVFSLDDPSAAEPALERALAADACPAVVAPHTAGGRELLCAVIDAADRDPVDVAADARRALTAERGAGPRRRQPPGPARGRCATPSTRRAAPWRRPPSPTATPRRSPPGATSAPSPCCSRSRTTRR